MIARRQLIALGYGSDAIRARLDSGRLHPVHRGVYAVGRPELTSLGRWMAAVLAAGPGAVLSHESAAALWGLVRSGRAPGAVHVSVPERTRRRVPGVTAHRRRLALADPGARDGIVVTTPVLTLVDLAAELPRRRLEAAINEADRLDLADPDQLRAGLEVYGRRRGAAALRATLDRHTFVLTESELERYFLPIVRRAGLSRPEKALVNGFRVDFFWPDLGLVVETDGLRYHRTPAQQARDRIRDQAHTAAGLVPLRFTHAQIRFEPRHVEGILVAVARRLRAERALSTRGKRRGG